MILRIAAIAALVLSASCNKTAQKSAVETKYNDSRDVHSYSNPQQVRVRHVALDLEAQFEKRILQGTATLTVNRAVNAPNAPLLLDTRDLNIKNTEASTDGGASFAETAHQVGPADPILGSPLRVQMPPNTTHVRITYATSPSATGLQWLTPQQTASKTHPFLYSQSQAIHARSWIPLQDSPGVRVTYSANIKVPKGLTAVMSARSTGSPAPGEYTFEMQQAIPSYLIALAAGDLEYRAISKRTGVWAEPNVIGKAVKEFEDLEKMMQAAENLYGMYQWQQYDVLVLPPSFPYGGMENPRLTFVTPTLLAGDKSLVGVIAHELAHSWSGNLVTNATWRDFWLNEGFTTYFERRIQEEVYGPDRSRMEALLERQELLEEFKRLEDKDEILYIDLKGRDPDEGMNQVPYVKGMLFLRYLEELYGRERFDAFLRTWFGQHAFRSVTTGDFVQYLKENLLNTDPSLAARVDLEEWLTEPGLPDVAPVPKSDAFARVEKQAQAWMSGAAQLASIPTAQWSTQEWLHFLRSLPEDLDRGRMAQLDQAFNLTKSGNAEILFQWLMMSIRSEYEPAYPAMERFLIEVGRRKFIRPLYQELVNTPDGLRRAQAIYKKARPGYHPISQITVDELIQKAGGAAQTK